MLPRYQSITALICLLLASAASLAAAEGVEGVDTRILIDVSGSMKTNDPANLRRPALRLLVGLLPEDARAGVWTFGQYVNMLVPLGKVDNAWKIRARQGAGKIHSRGLFTNIEEALERSVADWQHATAAVNYRRHLILLTDGVVDISKDIAQNDASRERILTQLLPRLQEYGAKVHTIALSDRADHELMKLLSDQTGGWYEQVNDAAQLQRIFLRLFEKVGRPDSVPLKENRFTIDSSISEATLLVFRGDSARPTQVTTPSGSTFGATDAPDNVSWHRDEGYDLLTISNPEVGEWLIQAAVDPDNRVMVVTDLKMQATELPNKLALGEQLPLLVHFTQGGEKITQPGFLELINLQVEQSDAQGPTEPRTLFDDGKQGDAQAGDGEYTLILGDQATEGTVDLLLNVEGKTFKREQRQTFTIVPSYRVEISKGEKPDSTRRVTLIPDTDLLDPTAVSIQGSLSSDQYGSHPVMVLPAASGVGWEIQVDPATLAGSWSLEVHLSAKTRSGNQLEIDLEPQQIEGAMPSLATIAAPTDPAKAASETEAPDWVMLGSLFGVGNLLLLLIAGTAYWWVKKNNSRDHIQLLDDEDETAVKGVAG
ncbi:MAG: VWA domain-containing protein [Gammaproteobacteria bacterium]|nr:VWA domain-containing protein [Gammaproteobacteria bacterium]MCP5416783.1 VWA domain-containing protein [Chromatiaceae bacterium]